MVKIEDRSFSVVRNRKTKEKSAVKPGRPRKTFKEQLSRIEQKEIKERLDKLLNIVDSQGEKLKKSLDKKDLLEYKKRVQDFLRLIQKEFVKAKQSFSWDGSGNLKTYTIVEKVNKNLDTLHELFLQDQADVLQIVKKIDEIRGLLLDLYI